MRNRVWKELPFSQGELEQAARAAGQAITDSLPEPEDCTYTFSPEFYQKMDGLAQKTNRAGWTNGFRRAACFFLALLLSGTAWLTVDAQAREKVFGWFSEYVIDAARYFHQGAVTKEEDVVHYQIEVPDGYYLKELLDVGSCVDEYYRHESESKHMGFSYQYVTENGGGELYIIGDTAKKKQVFVHGLPADLYLEPTLDKTSIVVWRDTETGALIEVGAQMSERDLLALAETVVPIEEREEAVYESSYELPVVPAGYDLEDIDTGKIYKTWRYVNDDGQYLYFGYMIKETEKTTTPVGLVADGMEQKTVLVHGQTADYYFDAAGKERNMIVWEDVEQGVLLSISACLSESEMIQMAETVVRAEK